jgi:hypothetical protein
MPVALLYWSKARLVLNSLWKKTHHVSKKKNANSFLCMQKKEEKETQIWGHLLGTWSLWSCARVSMTFRMD